MGLHPEEDGNPLGLHPTALFLNPGDEAEQM